MRRLRFRIWLITKLGGDPWSAESQLWDLEQPVPSGPPSAWVGLAALVAHMKSGDDHQIEWLEDELMPRIVA